MVTIWYINKLAYARFVSNSLWHVSAKKWQNRVISDKDFTKITRSSAIAVIADRTACSILTLFIVNATSRPLNKKSVCCQSADPTITADLRPQSAVRTPLLHLQSVAPCDRSRHRVIVDKRAVPFRLPA